jgi:hypothetical protein
MADGDRREGVESPATWLEITESEPPINDPFTKSLRVHCWLLTSSLLTTTPPLVSMLEAIR